SQALERDPDERFETAGEMREALLRVLRNPAYGTISSEVLAARMLEVFAQQRADMRAQVKSFLDERDRPASTVTGLSRIDISDGTGSSTGGAGIATIDTLSPVPRRNRRNRRFVVAVAALAASAALGAFLFWRSGGAPAKPGSAPEPAATAAAAAASPARVC